MKKLALTFSILCALGAFTLAGQDKDQPAGDQTTDWYRAHEWDFDLWGTYAFPDNTGDHTFSKFFTSTDEGTVHTNGAPSNGDVFAAFHTSTSNDRFIDRDNAWGGGADVKYFFSKYWALGVEGFVLDCNTNAGGGGLGTFTFRYPIGQSRFAPYIWAGFGDVAGGGHHEEDFGFIDRIDGMGQVSPRQGEERFVFDNNTNIQNKHSEATGQVGTGLEVRITKRIGVMGDFAWNALSGPNNNFGMTRFGVTLSY